MNRHKWLLLGVLLLSSCYRVPNQIDPQIDYAVQERYLKKLSSSFTPLSMEEKKEDWGKEYLIGLSFAKELDLYQAITAFKRAAFLIPPYDKARKLEIQYEILLCYFLGTKYEEVISTFKTSDLRAVDPSFPAYHDLLVILYESYLKTNDPQSARQILEMMHQSSPQEAEKLFSYNAIAHANFPQLELIAKESEDCSVKNLLSHYNGTKKSVQGAQILNGLLPGAGYLYIGQKQSAITAFLLNGLFLFAAYEFFHHGYVAAGVITTSFEMGWYFGGIYGAGEEAQCYNQRLYEKEGYNVLNQERLFPVLMLQYGF
jgi:tetratricopeptide (TPR) repeat protein